MKFSDLVEEAIKKNPNLLTEGAFRDFLNEIALGNYQYLVGKDRNGKIVIKNIDNGEFVSFVELIEYLGLAPKDYPKFK